MDELLLYVAPALLGQGLPAFALPAVPGLDDRIRLAWREASPVGDDLRMRLRVLTEAHQGQSPGSSGANGAIRAS